MNTPGPLLSEASIRKSRRRVLWLAGFFFVPLALSFVLYYGGLWRPQGGTNKGELINPPRPLPTMGLTLADGTQSAPEILQGKWTWAYIGDGQCDARCRAALTDTRQARLLLSEKINRVQRVFFATGECCDMPYLNREHPGLIVARFDKPELTAAFLLDAQVSPDEAGRIYLIDPLGNLMMSYAPDAPSMGLLEDIKKLLKLSHIG
jgi:cytochrome oxidase Cu insertion factor (SCO1/SenC/PrrC family)